MAKKTIPPHLMELQKVPGKRDTWVLEFEGLDEEVFSGSPITSYSKRREELGEEEVRKADAAHFNGKLNAIGKRIFGEGNFDCDDKNGPGGGRGTGMLVMNYQGITTCKIKFPGEPEMRSSTGGFLYQGKRLPAIKMLDHASHIEIKWKDAISNVAVPTGIKIRNTYNVGFHDSDIHEIAEAYHWEWCEPRHGS
jgi:hypothetical protein